LDEATVSVKLQSPTDHGNGIMERALYTTVRGAMAACHGVSPAVICLPFLVFPITFFFSASRTKIRLSIIERKAEASL